jgi:hypothetical protein
MRGLTIGLGSTVAVGLLTSAALAAELATMTSEIHGPAHANLTSSEVLSGHMLHHSVQLSGDFGVPTGTVDFMRFSGQFCAGAPVATESDVSLVNGTAESTPWTSTPGFWSFRAHYDGDATYAAGDGTCDPIQVRRRIVRVNSEVHDSSHNDITGTVVAPGTVVHDQGIVTAVGPQPTGTVNFLRFDNPNCSGTPASVEADVPLGSGEPESSNFIVSETPSGGISYLVQYNGDVNYKPEEGPCEPLYVEQLGGQGCTPGYWKQPQHFGSWTGYNPTDSFEVVFARDAYAGSPTLLDALSMGGSGLEALGRHAVAGLLNATNPDVDYAFTSAEVIASYQAAFDSGDATMIEAAKNALEQANETGCTLARNPGSSTSTGKSKK